MEIDNIAQCCQSQTDPGQKGRESNRPVIDRSKHDMVSEKVTTPVLLIYVVLRLKYVVCVCLKTDDYRDQGGKYHTRPRSTNSNNYCAPMLS